jgi:hypothetical protein
MEISSDKTYDAEKPFNLVNSQEFLMNGTPAFVPFVMFRYVPWNDVHHCSIARSGNPGVNYGCCVSAASSFNAIDHGTTTNRSPSKINTIVSSSADVDKECQ